MLVAQNACSSTLPAFDRPSGSLTESEERFRNLFELEPTPIVIHDGVQHADCQQSVRDGFSATTVLKS